MQAFIDGRGVSGFDHAADLDGSIWAEYRIVSQPSFVFINDDGTMDTHLGALGADGLTERLNALTANQ